MKSTCKQSKPTSVSRTPAFFVWDQPFWSVFAELLCCVVSWEVTLQELKKSTWDPVTVPGKLFDRPKEQKDRRKEQIKRNIFRGNWWKLITPCWRPDEQLRQFSASAKGTERNVCREIWFKLITLSRSKTNSWENRGVRKRFPERRGEVSFGLDMEDVVHNWMGELSTRPQVVMTVSSAEEIADIVKNEDKYPSPLRAVGSRHSTTRCFEADGGTLIDMTAMNSLVEVDHEHMTATAEAGMLYIDLSHELQKQGLMHHVHLEIGNLTMGSAVVGQTKDGALPGGYGNVGSYVVGVSMVTAEGQCLLYRNMFCFWSRVTMPTGKGAVHPAWSRPNDGPAWCSPLPMAMGNEVQKNLLQTIARVRELRQGILIA